MKILVTGRDLGAGFNILELLKAMHAESDLIIKVIAQPPFFQLANSQLAGIIAIEEVPQFCDIEALIMYAKAVFNTFRPDVVLAGLSSPLDSGIDEAIIQVAKGRCATFVMQDFWGEVNVNLGTKADWYFCIDKQAQILTQARHNVDTVLIGSPKHASYAQKNFLDRKKRLRARMGIRCDESVIGYFGQALHKMPGYLATLQTWLISIKQFATAVRCAYRPHPRESAEDVARTQRLFQDYGLNPIVLDHVQPEDSLLFCDTVCSLFSNCSYDASYINYFSSCPMVVPVMMLFESDIQAYIERVVHWSDTPYAAMDLSIIVEERAQLQRKLEESLAGNTRHAIWLACKQLENPSQASQLAIKQLKELSCDEVNA